MALKAVTQAVESHVAGIWSKGLTETIPQEIVFVEQYSPPTVLINDFESRRNELDRSLAGRKLQTIQAFISLNEDTLKKVLINGFHKTLGNTKLAFSTDPAIAIREGFGGGYNKVLLCRIVLGREGADYSVVREKYVIENLKGVMPSFLITYGVPGEAVSLKPLDLPPMPEQPRTYQQPQEDEIVFQEAKVVHYQEHKNVFGDDDDPLAKEEARLMKHGTYK